eukprot:CAMPEP_0170752266 /NCGR_PEP_ID=MMETSP0437-20130122/11879_1 /TAXON_ID=0 /ORGANISM="Sexangularia sp." /LENGTH=472 /DNA_ID=CAMNT_0011091329 /DNA_START=11 /DNA_END=1428 /DNA_ORIENTATION=+
MFFTLLSLLSLAQCTVIESRFASPLADQYLITSLPGQPSDAPPFAQYAGQLVVNATAGRSLFFYYAEASSVDPATAPLQVWQTGGPGCSSLLGAFEEMGPWRPVSNSALAHNPTSWNTIANGLYIESPAGVGFSYSNTSSDYIDVNDTRTADDLVVFLRTFVHDIFPGLAKSPIVLTAESYGGHYNPNLAVAILESNKQNAASPLNLAAVLTGNAWTDSAFDNAGAMDTIWQRVLAPRSLVEPVFAACNLTDVGPLVRAAISSDACNDAITAAQSVFDDIDIYDIYTDLCKRTPAGAQFARFLAKAGSPAHRVLLGASKDLPFEPCISNYLTAYLNDPAVQAAMHVGPHAARTWSSCSSTVQYSTYDVLHTSTIGAHQKIWAAGIPDLVYSGDVDAIVPTMGSLYWIDSLNLTIAEPWRAWHHADEYGEQTGGFVQSYKEGLTFATVRNAGHEVHDPLAMFASFIKEAGLPA